MSSPKPNPIADIPAVSVEEYDAAARFAGSAIVAVFENLGGIDAFTIWARENQDVFYGKFLPQILAPVSKPVAPKSGGGFSLADALNAVDDGVA